MLNGLLDMAGGLRSLASGLLVLASRPPLLAIGLLLLTAGCDGGQASAPDRGASADDPASSAAGPRHPNLLLISIDSLRADHVGCYGYSRDTSPVIDGLAREGVRFAVVASPSSWTLPAHATLFTALPPEGHGLRQDAIALTDDALCLAEVLKRAGYATAAFVGGPFLRSMYGLDQGFDVYDESVVRSFRESQQGSTSPRLLQLVRNWLESWDEAGRTQPFFVFLHLWDVHYDYVPPAPYDTMFDPDYRGTVSGEGIEVGHAMRIDMDPRDLQHVVSLYDGEIRYTDGELGGLLDWMQQQGLGDTALALTADHGEEFFEHGAKGHRRNLFDTTLMVPLILHWPSGLPSGVVVDSQVRLMDLPVTLLSMAGVERPFNFGFASRQPGLAPVNLLDLIRGAQTRLGRATGGGPDARPASSGPGSTGGSRTALADLPAFGDLQGRITSLRGDGFKLLRERRRNGALDEQLYRLRAGELEQPVDQGAEDRLAMLRQQLREWTRLWARRRPPSEAIELSDEQQQTLRALGYIR